LRETSVLDNSGVRAAADTRQQMWQLMTAFRISRAIGVAVELRIPEFLARHPHTAAQLAADTNAHQPSLERLLHTLVAAEVLAKDASGRFSLTPLGEELNADRLGPAARFLDGENDFKSWTYLEHSIRTGERAFDHAFGMRNWDYYARNPAQGAIFDAAMRSLTTPTSRAVATVYDFSGAAKVADIGGGDGTMLVSILERNPHLRGVLFDRPGVIERARSRVEEAGLADRVELIGGSFFEAVPAGADVYLMKSIIHDWEDGDAIAIMTKCRAAAGSGGAALLVVERHLSDEIGPDDLNTMNSDLNMLVNPGGRERTDSEYAELFRRSGYRLERTLPLAVLNHQILEAVPV
jgi:orsellinic acid C2-O-methyltransferase